MLLAREFPHIRPTLHDYCLRQRYSKPTYFTQIHPTDTLQMFADAFRVLWFIFAMRVSLAYGGRLQFSSLPIWPGQSIYPLDLIITSPDLLSVKVIHL